MERDTMDTHYPSYICGNCGKYVNENNRNFIHSLCQGCLTNLRIGEFNKKIQQVTEKLLAEASEIKRESEVPQSAIDDYRDFVRSMAIYPGHRCGPEGLTYATVALCGESGELANEYKKYLRGDFMDQHDKFHEKMLLELGDILYYVFCVADELGSDIHMVMRMNREKLEKRRRESSNGK